MSIKLNYRLPRRLEGTILAEILNARLPQIAGARDKWPDESIRMVLDRAPRVRSLKRALLRSRRPAIIAEVKRASPSAGELRADFDPLKIGREYEQAGAAAVSVLTEGVYFHGQIEYLAALRWNLGLPLLCKDFIVDPYQVLQARHAGADAVMLIAALHDKSTLRQLRSEVEGLGMEALVEVHSEMELEAALAAGASLIGVNNRDLSSMQVSLDVSLRLASRLPKDVVAVAASGIQTAEDIRRLGEAGYRGFLIGEPLMRSPSPGKALSDLRANAAPKGRSAA